jgi:hypothetical protein
MRKPAIIAAIIGAAAVIVAAVIGIYPFLRTPQAPTVVAGIVVALDTKRAVGQAIIVVTGRAEQAVTDDNGSFRIDLPASAPGQLRILVNKTGFQTLDTTIVAPAANLVLLLSPTMPLQVSIDKSAPSRPPSHAKQLDSSGPARSTWRYKPTDPSVPVDMNVFVTKTYVDGQYRLDVSFAVPPAHLQYDTISIYGYRMFGPNKKMRENVPASTFSSLKGNWKPAQHVTLQIDVPKQFGNPADGWQVRFCAGEGERCFPSPNLLEGDPVPEQ